MVHRPARGLDQLLELAVRQQQRHRADPQLIAFRRAVVNLQHTITDRYRGRGARCPVQQAGPVPELVTGEAEGHTFPSQMDRAWAARCDESSIVYLCQPPETGHLHHGFCLLSPVTNHTTVPIFSVTQKALPVKQMVRQSDKPGWSGRPDALGGIELSHP